MKKIAKLFAIVLTLAILLTSVALMSVFAKEVTVPVDVSGWTYQNGAAYDADAQKINVPAGQIQRVISTYDLDALESADLDISFTAKFTAGPAADWRAMIFLRDQDPGKASWEGRAADSAYMWMFGNNVVGLKNATMGSLGLENTDVSNFMFTDGAEHTYRFVVKNEADGVRLQLYIDGEQKANVLDTANTVTGKGQVTMVFAGDNQVAGEIYNVVTNTDDGTFDLTEDMGKVDMFAAENFANIKYGQGAEPSADKSVITIKPISDTVMTNGRIYLDSILAKDVTLECELQLSSMPANLTDWVSMIFLRDQAPGNASWERNGFYEEGKKTAQGYCIMMRTDRIEVLYVDSVSQRTIASAEYPAGFNFTEKNQFSLDVCEIDEIPTITVKINGTEVLKAKAEASKNQVLVAGGITIVAHTDVAGVTMDVTKLSLDLAAKSGASEPATKPNDNPTTGDSIASIVIAMALTGAAAVCMIVRKKD